MPVAEEEYLDNFEVKIFEPSYPEVDDDLGVMAVRILIIIESRPWVRKDASRLYFNSADLRVNGFFLESDSGKRYGPKDDWSHSATLIAGSSSVCSEEIHQVDRMVKKYDLQFKFDLKPFLGDASSEKLVFVCRSAAMTLCIGLQDSGVKRRFSFIGKGLFTRVEWENDNY